MNSQEEATNSKLDSIRNDIAILREKTKHVKLIDIPYRGGRTSCFCYHPKTNPNFLTAYEEAKAELLLQIHGWLDVVRVYESEMNLSEKIVSDNDVRDIFKVIEEADKDRDPYILEALGEMIFDKEGATQNEDGSFDHKSEKAQQHSLDFMAALKKRAQDIKFEDFGINIGKEVSKTDVIKHTWSG